MRQVDPHFIENCISSGMSSGEGLIAAVAADGEREPEKRRLVVESEFAQVMKVLSREGNTLSPVVRNAWDGKTLQTMVRNAPLRTSGTHIGIIGHITKEELLRHINGTELANGFFNRFMLIAVQRSKKLPFGGALRDEDLVEVRSQLAAAILFAGKQQALLTFNDDARAKWIAVYDELSDGHPGLWGAATARAEAHTVRLALLYALLDCSPTIRVEHLDAALAFWAYASRSARWVFGDSLGDPTADEIWDMAKLHPDGVTRTQVSDLFSRNKKAREIDRALNALVEAGRLERGELRGSVGRPAAVWRPATTPAQAA